MIWRINVIRQAPSSLKFEDLLQHLVWKLRGSWKPLFRNTVLSALIGDTHAVLCRKSMQEICVNNRNMWHRRCCQKCWHFLELLNINLAHILFTRHMLYWSACDILVPPVMRIMLETSFKNLFLTWILRYWWRTACVRTIGKDMFPFEIAIGYQMFFVHSKKLCEILDKSHRLSSSKQLCMFALSQFFLFVRTNILCAKLLLYHLSQTLGKCVSLSGCHQSTKQRSSSLSLDPRLRNRQTRFCWSSA